MPPHPDRALTAVRTALKDAHNDLDEIIVARPQDTARFLVVRYNPWNGDDFSNQGEQHAAYALTLRAAGWSDALDLGELVLVPDVPLAESAPGTFTASWAVAIGSASGAQDAADQARERQLDPGVTEAVWTVTDAVGRSAIVHTQDPDLA